MSDSDTYMPAVAVAVAQLYTPGSFNAEGVVQGTAVGISQRTPRHQQPLGPSSSEPFGAPVAESFLYSPAMAKVFAQVDTTGNGVVDVPELQKLLVKLGLGHEDASNTMTLMDDNGDGVIQLSEWEKGLEPRIRSLIEAKVNDEGLLED